MNNELKPTNNQSAFSLIELLVAITIAGILAGIAVPAYSGYMLRSKIEAMRSEAAGAQFAVQNDYYNYNKSFSSSNYSSNSTAFTSAKANFISSITIANGVITVTGNAAKLNNKQINLRFDPAIDIDGSISWSCHCDQSFHDYAPPECKNPW